MKEAINTLSTTHSQVVFYGEIFGRKVQKLDYGLKGYGYGIFDILIDGNYVAPGSLDTLCTTLGLEMVPYLGIVPFSMDNIKRLASGPAFSGSHVREGVVVRPLEERYDPKIGRVVLKYISDEYLYGLKEDFTDV